MSASLADFVPKRKLISNVTTASRAVVTTSSAHGYDDVSLVRLHVLPPNPMILEGVEAQIKVLDSTSFETNVDTTILFPFAEPTLPTQFTPSHVVPINGPYFNDAGPLT